MDNWLQTDHFQEAISSLEILAEQTSIITKDIYRWKWAVISLHNALQGFMVLALKGSSGLNVMRSDDSKAWLDAYRNCIDELPNSKLDNFLNLYKKLKSDCMMQFIHSKKFAPNITQGNSIKMLNKLRNDFIHFQPKIWSLEISGLPHICIDCLGIIKFCGWDSGNILWHDNSYKYNAEIYIAKANNKLTLLKEIYEK